MAGTSETITGLHDTDVEAPPLPEEVQHAIDKSLLWGYLKPRSRGPSYIMFPKSILRWTIGRKSGNNINLIVLDSFRISSQHCVITYHGNNKVTVLDMSLNGTWIKGRKIGKGNTEELHDGDEICLTTTEPYPQNGGVEDFRYIYCHTVDGTVNDNVLDNYEIGPEIGRGAYSVVHEATDKVTRLPFAMKIIQKHNGNTEPPPARALRKQNAQSLAIGNVDYIRRELTIMKNLEHPNVCKLLQTYIDENLVIYVVLERMDGGDLLSLVNSKGRLPERHGRDIIYQVCEAMAYIHSERIVHRDLKMENILVTKEEHPIAKVADFGIAREVDDLKKMNTFCGTRDYLAPEIIDPSYGGYDNRVDSWCMGLITYSTLTGLRPFKSKGFNHREIDWVTFTNTRGCTPEAMSFTSALLQVDPNDRLSLSKAHDHFWLRDHIPYHGGVARTYVPRDYAQIMDDAKLASRLQFEEVQACKDRDPPRPHSPLKRQIDILQGQPNSARPTAPTRRSARNKRPSEMPPIAEEEAPQSAESFDDVEMRPASPVKTPRPSRKKARIAYLSPKKAGVGRGAVEDVTMESPVKPSAASSRSTATPLTGNRYSTRIRKMSDRR